MTDLNENRDVQQAPRHSPFVQEAMSFPATGKISERGVSAWVMSRMRSLLVGDLKNADPEQVLAEDPILNADLSETEAAHLAGKLSACQSEAVRQITEGRKILAGLEPAEQREVLGKILRAGVEPLGIDMQKYQAEKSASAKVSPEQRRKEPTPAQAECMAFLEGRSSELSLKAVRSHMLTAVRDLCIVKNAQGLWEPGTADPKQALLADPLFSRDLSATAAAEAMSALPGVIERNCDEILRTRSKIAPLLQGDSPDTALAFAVVNRTARASMNGLGPSRSRDNEQTQTETQSEGKERKAAERVWIKIDFNARDKVKDLGALFNKSLGLWEVKTENLRKAGMDLLDARPLVFDRPSDKFIRHGFLPVSVVASMIGPEGRSKAELRQVIDDHILPLREQAAAARGERKEEQARQQSAGRSR